MNDESTSRQTGRGNAAKRWVFTLNNPTPDETRDLTDALERGRIAGTVLYYVFGREVGLCGTPHLQGYLELAKKQRLSGVKSFGLRRGHLECSKGTAEEAARYCKKDGEFTEAGSCSSTRSVAGFRSDLQRAKTLIDQGKSLSIVADECFSVFLRYPKGLQQYASFKSVKRNWVTEVYVYYGKTGTGKTRAVHTKEASLWVAVDNSLCWFDSYSGEEAVLFDDFISVKNQKFGFLLQLLDRYAMQVPVKGGFVPWIPKRIYFTSNLPVDEWFTGVSPESLRALRRRITEEKEFDGTDLEEDPEEATQ